MIILNKQSHPRNNDDLSRIDNQTFNQESLF